MPVQTQTSSLLERLGRRMVAANEVHRDKPVDVGIMRLPPGIRDGVAKLQSMTWGVYKDGALKGKDFFRAAAVVLSPLTQDGHRCEGLQTSVMIPMCDIPAANGKDAVTLEDNFFKYQNLFRLLGTPPCPETPKTDPTGARTFAYFAAAAQNLLDPRRPPVYVSFTTRGWTPPVTQQNPHPEMRVFETWHGLAQWDGVVDPGAGVVDNTAPPEDNESPPRDAADDSADTSREDEVADLIHAAETDPEGSTESGRFATARLEEMAWEMGWSKEQTAGASSWEEVGDMALVSPEDVASPDEGPASSVTVGSRWLFAKRDKSGAKLKDARGNELPPQEVEVDTVDEESQTCTVKSGKDGKLIVDLRSKKPVVVKWDWLEAVSY